MGKIKYLLMKVANLNLWWAASSGASAFIASLLLGINFKLEMFLILFLITFSIYSFNGYTDKKEDAINTPERGEFIGKFDKLMLLLSVIAYFLVLWISYSKSKVTLIIVLVAGLIGLIYSVKIIPIKLSGEKLLPRLKEIPVIKNASIGFAWALATVFIPVSFASKSISISDLIVFVIIFFRTFINTVTFDMRDIKGDMQNNIKTIPVILGFNKTKGLLLFINSFLGLFILLSTLVGVLPPLGHVINISTVYTFFYLYFIDKVDDMRFYCAIIVDGEYLFLGLVSLLWLFLL